MFHATKSNVSSDPLGCTCAELHDARETSTKATTHVTNRCLKLTSFPDHTFRVVPAEAGIQYRHMGILPMSMIRQSLPLRVSSPDGSHRCHMRTHDSTLEFTLENRNTKHQKPREQVSRISSATKTDVVARVRGIVLVTVGTPCD